MDYCGKWFSVRMENGRARHAICGKKKYRKIFNLRYYLLEKKLTLNGKFLTLKVILALKRFKEFSTFSAGCMLSIDPHLVDTIKSFHQN